MFGYGIDGGVGPVADLNTLTTAIPVSTLPDGLVVFIQAEASYWQLRKGSGATPVYGYVTTAYGGASTDRWLKIPLPDQPVSADDASGVLAMICGDSLTTGSSAAPGGSLPALQATARAMGLNVRCIGPVVTLRAQLQTPYEGWSAGYPGKYIEDMTALWGGTPTVGAPTPLIQQFLAKGVVPKCTPLLIGTNNLANGDSGALAYTKLQTCALQILSQLPAPNRLILETIPYFYSPFAPTGGLVAANAQVDIYNTLIKTVAPLLSSRISVVDLAANLSQAQAYTDGEHLLFTGEAEKGALEAKEIARLFPQADGPTAPRPFKMRTKQPSVNLPTKGTSKIQTTADNGWRIQAQNFLLGARIDLLDYAAGVNNYIMEAYPNGGSFANGWALTLDASVTPAVFNFTIMGTATAIGAAPVVKDQPMWLFVHGDIVQGVISIWMAMPSSDSAPGAPWVVSMVAAATGVAAWVQGTANPVFNAGTDSAGRAGVAMNVDNIFFAPGIVNGAQIPGVFAIREVLENIVYDGGCCPNVTAYLPATEGTGNSVASIAGGTAGTITTGGWMLAGELFWPSDEDAAIGQNTFLAVVAMADANQVLPAANQNATVIEATGALTADRQLNSIPRIKGRVITINNKTTGGHNVVLNGLLNAAAGISRAYWDGTTFVAA